MNVCTLSKFLYTIRYFQTTYNNDDRYSIHYHIHGIVDKDKHPEILDEIPTVTHYNNVTPCCVDRGMHYNANELFK